MSTLKLQLEQQEFVRVWSDKFDALANMANSTRNGVASIAAAVGQNFAAVKANLEANSDAIEQLDIYNQIWAKMFLCLLECILEINGIVPAPEIKDRAKNDFQALFVECKARVVEEREAYIKAIRARVEEEQRAATKPSEEDMAKETLSSAESSISTFGGEGSAIPDGAEIFGG